MERGTERERERERGGAYGVCLFTGVCAWGVGLGAATCNMT